MGPLIPIEKKKKLFSYFLVLFITTISIFISNGKASTLNHIALFTHSEGKTAIIEIDSKKFIIGNLPDRKVEAIFEGEEENIKKMLKWCAQGPPLANVTSVDYDWEIYTGNFRDFRIKY